MDKKHLLNIISDVNNNIWQLEQMKIPQIPDLGFDNLNELEQEMKMNEKYLLNNQSLLSIYNDDMEYAEHFDKIVNKLCYLCENDTDEEIEITDEEQLIIDTLSENINMDPEWCLGYTKTYKIDQFIIFYCTWCGYEYCPFFANVNINGELHKHHCNYKCSSDYIIYNQNNKKHIIFPGLIIHLIHEHKFFEGSSYRLNPSEAIDVLEINDKCEYHKIITKNAWQHVKHCEIVPNKNIDDALVLMVEQFCEDQYDIITYHHNINENIYVFTLNNNFLIMIKLLDADEINYNILGYTLNIIPKRCITLYKPSSYIDKYSATDIYTPIVLDDINDKLIAINNSRVVNDVEMNIDDIKKICIEKTNKMTYRYCNSDGDIVKTVEEIISSRKIKNHKHKNLHNIILEIMINNQFKKCHYYFHNENIVILKINEDNKIVIICYDNNNCKDITFGEYTLKADVFNNLISKYIII